MIYPKMACEGQFINYAYPTVDVGTKLETFIRYIAVSATAIDVIDKIPSDFEESFSLFFNKSFSPTIVLPRALLFPRQEILVTTSTRSRIDTTRKHLIGDTFQVFEKKNYTEKAMLFHYMKITEKYTKQPR